MTIDYGQRLKADLHKWQNLSDLARTIVECASTTGWIVPNPAVGQMAEGRFVLGKGLHTVVLLLGYPAPWQLVTGSRNTPATQEQVDAAFRAAPYTFDPGIHLKEFMLFQK